MDYLDCPEAQPLRDNIRDIVARNHIRSVVDVGCGTGSTADLLDLDHYMGFDPWRPLIQRARRLHKHLPHCEFRRTDWTGDITVDFDVDCVLFVGSLSYNQDHEDGFERLVDLYNPRVAIIQEILPDQTHIVPENNLKTIPLDHYTQYPHVWHEFDLPVWCGHRVQLEIRIPQTYMVFANDRYIDLVYAVDEAAACAQVESQWGPAHRNADRATHYRAEKV